MRVKAVFKKVGGFGVYGGKRRYHGDEFDIGDKEKLGSWMVKVDERKKPGPKPKVEETGEGAE